MGVNNLWTLLSDVCEQNVDLSSLHGLTLAVDLSSWICELKTIQFAQHMNNIHIRNLYFRTAHLLKQGIKLVFIEDGTAPELKKAALLKRNGGIGESLERNRLKKTSEQCKSLLTYLGLPCIQSRGEAEALCAQLNRQGLVDGVLTSDGDALVYGAKKVYRNLNINENSVECCSMENVETKLNVNRRGLVTLALLSGCDYKQEGVDKVGIRKACDFVQHCTEIEVDPIDRIKNWRSNTRLNNLQIIKENPQKKQNHCSRCKHLGTKPEHDKEGCNPCDKEQSCDPDNHVTCTCDHCIVDQNKMELRVRERALQDPHFPDQDVIDEFLNFEQVLNPSSLQWKGINVTGLRLFMKENLHWKDGEFFNKVSELLITLHVIGMDWAVSYKPVPERIIRKCKHKKLPCVEVEWDRFEFNTVTDKHVVTVTEENFTKLYPEMMAEFNRKLEEERQQKKETKKIKGKKRNQPSTDEKQGTLLTSFFSITKKARLSPTEQLKPSTQL